MRDKLRGVRDFAQEPEKKARGRKGHKREKKGTRQRQQVAMDGSS